MRLSARVSIKENSNFTDVKNLNSSLPSVRRQVFTEQCWCYPSLPPSSPSPHPPLGRRGSVAVIGGGCRSGSRARPPWCCTVVVRWPWKETQQQMPHSVLLSETKKVKCRMKMNSVAWLVQFVKTWALFWPHFYWINVLTGAGIQKCDDDHMHIVVWSIVHLKNIDYSSFKPLFEYNTGNVGHLMYIWC